MQKSIFTTLAEKENLSLTEFILKRIKHNYKLTGQYSTLFAACPNSESVIKAALRAAYRANAPIEFAATLNQVDVDGGYTGMDQYEFVKKIHLEADAIGYSGPIIIGLDHGGPWLKDIQTIEKWDYNRCMDWLKNSLVESVKAGYDLLHIDPTVDITVKEGQIIPIELVADRTLELIAHVEQFRRSHNYPKIAYEVGTEEVHGGLADISTFTKFLSLLKKGLTETNLGDVWPCFIVGKVGTDLHTTIFDAQVAKKLSEEAARYGSVIKGHYSDNVSNPEEYPLSGMGAANVGPEFTEAEYDGLMVLIKKENELKTQGRIATPSKFKAILENAVISSGRWKKWLLNNEKGLEFDKLSPARKEWLIKTGCRYVWAQDSVYAARQKLYENLRRNGIQAEEIVLIAIERVMDKYFSSFNLLDLNKKILD
ncbi:MAG TPA: class II D-tagatose-bisphosphate aldolase, non-catalytic subunit [bacterium]|nr:class II D-tagatose-bisphosphate aldolase, non-catalytic subunit [bacterium]HPN43569.1 class II D-tagatose-bisphosphate aldolase, non-catalytic subunit [bacterium]